MRFLPFRKYKFEIQYSASEFEDKLSQHLERNNRNLKGIFKSYSVVFRGVIRNHVFELYRRGFGNTSFIPRIKGTIFENKLDNSTYIEMKISYHDFVNVFLLMWFGFVLIFFIASIVYSFISKKFSIGILITLGMLLITYAGIMITFTEEVKTIKRYFSNKWYIKIE